MEALRSSIRGFIGYRSWIYRCAATLLDVYYAASREGGTGLRVLRMRHRIGPGIWMHFHTLKFPIFIRPGTADVTSIVNNVFREEYGRLPKGFLPRVVLDAGAYVGDTAAYYLSRFEDATVIALEPSQESYQLADRNLANYQGRVILLQRALSDFEGSVRLSGHQTGALVSESGLEVEATTIPALLIDRGIECIDLLKMDIEGSEVTVLRSGVGGWLRQIGMLLLETHGKEIENEVIPLLEREGFSIHRHRNVWYCVNQGRI